MEKSNSTKKKLGFRQVIMGSIFLNKEVLQWLPIVGLVALLGLLMISTRFRGEKILRATVEVHEEVKDLRSESATVDSELMKFSRYSEILKAVEKRNLGLKQPNNPPMKIKVKKL